MRLLGVLSISTALIGLLGPVGLYAKKPKVFYKEFDHLPQTYFYFEDSSVILFLEEETRNIWRSNNDGEEWTEVKELRSVGAFDIYQHPFNKEKAYVMTDKNEQYYTKDKGLTWKKFETKLMPTVKRSPLSFNSQQKDYILFTGMICDQDDWGGWWCKEQTFYTKDGFESNPKPLTKKYTHGCMFAQSTEIFDKASDSTILCIVDGDKQTPRPEDRTLLVSDSFDFDSSAKEPYLDGQSQLRGLAGLAAVKKFIVAAVKSAGTDEMSLFVSDDAAVWDRAEFPHDHGGLKEDAYTVLESTAHSIQVDVLITTSRNAVGSLFTSNSNGTYFTRNINNTNRNHMGNVDFEQVAGIEGIVLVNVVDNAKELLRGAESTKKIKSQISFDDGRTFHNLKDNKGSFIHVHSVTDIRNGGRVFSSPAPGLLMAVGNTGAYLKDYNDGDLYVSDDAGLTWTLALTDAHKYEFGDSGSILLAVYDEGRTQKMMYSLNHGKNWEEIELDKEVRPWALTTVPDSTSKKFTMIAQSKEGKAYVFTISFEGVLDRKCTADDFEKWYARKGDDGQPSCLMGHKQYFNRRRKDAQCFVEAEYKDPKPEQENCPCTDADYECDFEFKRLDGECKLVGRTPAPKGACKKAGEKYKGSSGYRLIPGNTCDKSSGVKKDEPIERECDEKDTGTPALPGNIKSSMKVFDKAEVFKEYWYLERASSATGNDETIIMRTDQNEIWITHDQGGNWEQPPELKDQEITRIYRHPSKNDIVYFLTPSKKFYYTFDRGKKIHNATGPNPPINRRDIPFSLLFHPTKTDLVIWISARDCDDDPKRCHAVAHYSQDRGTTGWQMLQPYVRNCAWIHSNTLLRTPEKLVFCERYARDEGPTDNPIKLISSEDFFAKELVHFEDISGFATMNEFILVAAVKKDQSLKLDASTDGIHFTDARFPPDFRVEKQQAYTVLDSVTHAIFLHVTVNPLAGSEYGAILKSNSDGVDYVLSLKNVNRNVDGYADFEKMQGIEGVAIVNVVINVPEVNKGGKKKLKTMMTHNDGGHWDFIEAPEKDVDGKSFGCDRKNREKCSLNLHGYTEREDFRDTFSSGSAVGLMIGVGNVGEYLTPKSDGHTFLTRDGGITWTHVKKGSYMWEYGDSGAIIVLVSEYEPTDVVYYSTDEGTHWTEYKFGDKITVDDITTIPSDTSRKFLLWGRKSGKATTVQLDFTGLTDQHCKQPEGTDNGDYQLWAPQHPALNGGCLFGREIQYYRKITDRNCYIGSLPQPKVTKNCTCEWYDYECDWNYEFRNGVCHLVDGLQKPDHSKQCLEDKNKIEYDEPTGYRRIPLTQCENGVQLDKSQTIPCKGHEDEWRKKHRASGGTIAFGVIIAFVGAGVIGWVVWRRWEGKFGAIRLGEDTSSSGQSPFVRYPIIAISAVYAVVVAIPTIVRAIAAWVGSKISRPRTYTTRGSFARGNYAVVGNDEGELLGSDDDDEV